MRSQAGCIGWGGGVSRDGGIAANQPGGGQQSSTVLAPPPLGRCQSAGQISSQWRRVHGSCNPLPDFPLRPLSACQWSQPDWPRENGGNHRKDAAQRHGSSCSRLSRRSNLRRIAAAMTIFRTGLEDRGGACATVRTDKILQGKKPDSKTSAASWLEFVVLRPRTRVDQTAGCP